MTPKEKAQELVNKMFFSIVDRKNVRTLTDYWDEAKQCSLICVDEAVNICYLEGYDEEDGEVDYWQQVKQEIQKL